MDLTLLQLEMMEVQWGLKESELAQERADVKKMAALFKQVGLSEWASKLLFSLSALNISFPMCD
jgi:hypothetical protein